jgi:hypothetical protein
MQKIKVLFLISLICIAAILVTGCTNSGSNPAPVTTPTSITLATTPILTTAAPVQQTPAPAITTVAAPITTAATPAATTADPILHRWVREISIPINGEKYGYEFKFYPGGTVNYRYGKTEMISSNLRIKTPTIEASGTWTNLGDNKYLVKFLPTAESGAQLLREYTLVPAHEVKEYPGVVIPTHIESSYETDAIGKAHVQSYGEMYYPELAKID